jgi:hypothetical protein
MHEVALADVDTSGVKWAVAFAVTFVVVDAGVGCAVVVAIGGVGVSGACGADGACVVIGVAVVDGIGVEDVGVGIAINFCLSWLHTWVRIADSCAWDIGLFFRLVAIRFSFSFFSGF